MKLFDNLIEKNDLIEMYDQQRVNLKDSAKHTNFIFVESSNFYQLGNAYLQFELFFRKNGGHFNDDKTDAINLVKNPSAHLFEGATIATTGGSEIEVSKPVGPVSTITRISTREDGDLSSYYDKFNEDKINDTTLKETLIDNHTTQANKKRYSVN